MLSSTPQNSSPKKKHSLVQHLTPVESLGDIHSEIQSRRQEAINKSVEARRRLSTAPLLAGYSALQLTQHCKDVIKLSTENKINCKNAFNFWLIDVMAAMAKKNDSEINQNFQVASCTLDASVKIYGYRVDAIHTDAIKMAGGFLIKETVAAEPKIDDQGENGDVHETQAGGAATRIKAKKKKKKLTVVPAESLNAKTEMEFFLEGVPPPNFLTRKSNGIDLLVKIPKHNDEGLLILDSEFSRLPFGEDASGSAQKCAAGDTCDVKSVLSLLSNVNISEKDHLCPLYENFEFGKVARDEDSNDDLQASQNSARFEFNEDAGFDESSNEESEEQRNRVDIPAGGFESDEEILVRPEKRKTDHEPGISDMKYRISVNPLEYSIFEEKTFKAWAGPAHWKGGPTRKPLEEFANKELAEELSKSAAASKRTRKGKIKCRAALFEALESVLQRNLAECEKTTLFKSTMLNWNAQNMTMPKDLKCQSKHLFSLYLIPSFAVTFNNEKEEPFEMSDHSASEEGNLEYCSSSVVRKGGDFECDEDCSLTAADDEKDSLGGYDAWGAENGLEVASKIAKIQVSACRRRKHVDIKHLKQGLWKVLAEAYGGPREAVPNVSVEFGHLLKIYGKSAPRSLRSVLSAPLLFNALLHLTNEKCLVLTQKESDKFNFIISQQ